MADNPKYFGQSTTGTPNQIEDGVDFPHTGLLKALSIASSGRYVVSGFNISGETTTAITVAAGKIMYNNFLVDVTGATLNLSTSHSNGYHLLVAPKPTGFAPNYVSPTVVLRNPTADNKVAEYTLGDTIIGVITHTGTTNAQVQFLTYDKTENSLSLAHHNSNNTYTEMGKVYAISTGIVIEQDSATNLGSIEIKNTDQDRDIVFTLNDGGVTKSVTLNADIATAQFADFSITTNGSVTANGVTLTGGGTVSNHGDNRIVTSGAANTNLNGEANLTFDGTTLANTGSYTATGGINVNLAVVAGTAVNSGTTMTAGGLITANAGIKNNLFYSTAYEILDIQHGGTQPTGAFSYIFIGDISPNPPHTPSSLISITLPPASTVVGRLLTFKNIWNQNVAIVASGAEKIDSSTYNPVPTAGGASALVPASGPNATYINLPPLQTITLMSIGGEAGLVPPFISGYYIMGAMS